jgi:hypothetical protein
MLPKNWIDVINATCSNLGFAHLSEDVVYHVERMNNINFWDLQQITFRTIDTLQKSYKKFSNAANIPTEQTKLIESPDNSKITQPQNSKLLEQNKTQIFNKKTKINFKFFEK